MKCPKCGSEHISQECRIDGDTVCMDCHHRGKPEEFRQKTNFDWIAAAPAKCRNSIRSTGFFERSTEGKTI